MSLNIPRELAKERVIASYKQDRNIARAAREGGVAYATANAWLAKAGLVHSDLVNPKHDSGMNRNVIKGPDPRNVARGDRDPCPRCNTRKDIGCKHFPKQPEAQRPMTDRERAEAMWSKSI